MKTKHIGLLILGIAAVGAAGFMTRARDKDLVVHEWGTFTSLQGSDGVPMKWNPLNSSEFPNFVYNWSRNGLDRVPAGMLALGTKSVLVTYQRMETPVVYFYAPKETTVDVTVRFPQGGITEWYPQAAEVGPSRYRASPVLASVDNGLHRCGVSPSFTVSSLFDPGKITESLIRWPDLRIVPAITHPELASAIPADASGSHYLAARATDSAYVRVAQWAGTNSARDCEKFLFYRGVGNFLAPLSVKTEKEGTLHLLNQGSGTISHAFILQINGEQGKFVALEDFGPGETREASVGPALRAERIGDVRKRIQSAMEHALVAEGLFPREAAAMVNTWKNSWFSEPGVRVLYLLPRAWTDETLPMSIKPEPSRLVRVMIGRAEVITPQIEEKLVLEINKAKLKDGAPQPDFQATVAELGRFAQPVFQRALQQAKLERDDHDRVLSLFYSSRPVKK